jgi:DNA polymerase III subunit epsilon
MRQIVLDTETTGLSTRNGDRVIEIGCVELVDLVPTGKIFHHYLNPNKEVSEGSFRVHGLSNSFLRQFPTFDKICDDFLKFIGEDELIAHNAQFDIKFINNELSLLDRQVLTNQAIDTLDIARKKFPGKPVSLDALCARFNISTEKREKHGALLDAELLAAVYLELNGGKQQNLFSQENTENAETEDIIIAKSNIEVVKAILYDEETAMHAKLMEEINSKNSF